jgi:hypothetical protein
MGISKCIASSRAKGSPFVAGIVTRRKIVVDLPSKRPTRHPLIFCDKLLYTNAEPAKLIRYVALRAF